VLYYLATQPHWQERLRHELQSAIEHKSYVGVEPRLDDGDVLEGLPVLNAVCNETLRYMPTTPVTSRVAGRDTTIMDVSVARGTKILIVPWTLNRSVDLYGPTAEEFDPTRWIDADGKPNNHGGASTNFAFSTFLHGPRRSVTDVQSSQFQRLTHDARCIGMEYAKGQIRAFVAAFVGRLYFEMAEPGEVIHQSGMFATRPREGLKLKIREVEAW
jgi:cytochrome P450